MQTRAWKLAIMQLCIMETTQIMYMQIGQIVQILQIAQICKTMQNKTNECKHNKTQILGTL